jgi:hypothetical protein
LKHESSTVGWGVMFAAGVSRLAAIEWLRTDASRGTAWYF